MTHEPTSKSSAASAEPTGPELDRRSFMRYVGAGVTTIAGIELGFFPLGCAAPGPSAWVTADGNPRWATPLYPIPLPTDAGDAQSDRARLARFEVVDDLVLPEGYRYDVVAKWGDVFGPADQPEHQVHFGYNNDYTGLVPIAGSTDEYWLFVNHEYLSFRPWLAAWKEDERPDLPELTVVEHPDDPSTFGRGQLSLDGWSPQAHMVDLAPGGAERVPDEVRRKIRRLCDAGLAELGVSVLRVRRGDDGRFAVVADAKDHRRIQGNGTENISAEVRSTFRFTGPGAEILGERTPRGTFANCSGGTTPWGTFLTCEENFHFEANEEISPAGELLEARRLLFGGSGLLIQGVLDASNPVPPNMNGLAHGLQDPLDGREMGWVCEVDPATGRLQKHTALGRFRHENVALRCEAGKRLAAYMGDDRRGGHIWKFVSDGLVRDPTDPANSALFEKGTLYVARMNDDFTGEWIALEPQTPLRRPEPEHCPSSHLRVPSRFVGGMVAIGDTERGNASLEVETWQATVEDFTGKPFSKCTVGDLVRPAPGASDEETRQRQRGVLVMDAFAMANTVGGTPSARPEDLEIHPLDGSVYIAFTDATGSGDGSPDLRVFPDSDLSSSRQYGLIMRLEEHDSDPAATTFTWGKLVSSGEIAELGGGFAAADNLVFDPQGNLWMVTDILTAAHNFPTARDRGDGTAPGGIYFPGVFGNNAMFMIPTAGTQRGAPHLFALGPMECELCGPTFTQDAKTLILAVQHPGELAVTREASSPSREQIHLVADREGEAFEQTRTVPIGSNFPSGELGRAPRPAVVCITRES
jgi:secreted PhoX family phosphatase